MKNGAALSLSLAPGGTTKFCVTQTGCAIAAGMHHTAASMVAETTARVWFICILPEAASLRGPPRGKQCPVMCDLCSDDPFLWLTVKGTLLRVSTMSQPGPAIVVIGAGVVGLSTALYLRRSGRDVVVIDPLPPPGGASFGNAGMISADTSVPIALPGM